MVRWRRFGTLQGASFKIHQMEDILTRKGRRNAPVGSLSPYNDLTLLWHCGLIDENGQMAYFGSLQGSRKGRRNAWVGSFSTYNNLTLLWHCGVIDYNGQMALFGTLQGSRLKIHQMEAILTRKGRRNANVGSLSPYNESTYCWHCGGID